MVNRSLFRQTAALLTAGILFSGGVCPALTVFADAEAPGIIELEDDEFWEQDYSFIDETEAAMTAEIPEGPFLGEESQTEPVPVTEAPEGQELAAEVLEAASEELTPAAEMPEKQETTAEILPEPASDTEAAEEAAVSPEAPADAESAVEVPAAQEQVPETEDSQTAEHLTADGQMEDSQTTDSQTEDSQTMDDHQTADDQTADSQSADNPSAAASAADVQFPAEGEPCSLEGVTTAPVNVFDRPSKTGSVLSVIPCDSGIYLLEHFGTAGESEEWYRILCEINGCCLEGYVGAENLLIVGTTPLLRSPNSDLSAFPEDYREKLSLLAAKHPNWIFQPVFVGDDFAEAVNAEQSIEGHCLVTMEWDASWRSLKVRGTDARGLIYDYNPVTGAWYEWEPCWAAANDEALAYFMDPRNFLDDSSVYMFESLRYEDYQTVEAVEAAVRGTFMSGALVPGERFTYAWLFCWIGKKYGINPVALASRVKQEQGLGNSPLISGRYPGYENLYNYFNMGATGVTWAEIYANGLTEARTGSVISLPDNTISAGPWNTPTKALIGGAMKFANYYIFKGHDTLYEQKFDIDDAVYGKYLHQYMTNIAAPFMEASSVKKGYESSGLTDAAIVFQIPVYQNMPASSPKPGTVSSNNLLAQITVNGQQVSFDPAAQIILYKVADGTVSAGISAKAAHEKAAAACEGAKQLNHKVGVTGITVTAENGSKRTYTLILYKDMTVAPGTFDTFDLQAYRNEHPELVQQYGNDTDAYYEHFALARSTGTEQNNQAGNGNTPQNPAASAVYRGIDYQLVFDAEYYLNRYADLKNAFGNDYAAALAHYVNYGIAEGRQACENFNISCYRENYSDLRNAFGSDNALYVTHYLEYGYREKRIAVKLAGTDAAPSVPGDSSGGSSEGSSEETEGGTDKGTTEDKGTEGTTDGSPSSGNPSSGNPAVIPAVLNGIDYSVVFDAEYYLNRYSDLKNAFGNDAQLALRHFVDYGIKEGRQGIKSFSVSEYKANYADLQKAFGNDNMSYVLHFINYGYKEKRVGIANSAEEGDSGSGQNADNGNQSTGEETPQTTPQTTPETPPQTTPSVENDGWVFNGTDYGKVFDPVWYLERYADLKAAFGDNYNAAFEHFIACGLAEGRQGCAAFSVEAYYRNNADLRAAFGKDNAKLVMHYLTCGYKENRITG